MLKNGMHTLSYLEQLTVRLALGLAQVPEAARAGHAAFVSAAQNADGGFSGREGPSDLYYTGFALRSLALLGALTPTIGNHAANFLRASLRQPASVVDLFSLLYSCRLIHACDGPNVLEETAAGWQDRTAAALETFRTPDGGYAKTPGGTAGSTYHTFLVTLCYELIERSLPEPERVLTFIRSRRRADGGYVEIAPMQHSGTNPTAAAVAVQHILGATAKSDEAVVQFLAGMVSPEGGLRANSRAPLADLLSTFTGLWTLHKLDALDRVDRVTARRYVEVLAQPAGGFRGGLWDEDTDLEYTFYGLGALALLTLAGPA